MSEVVRVLMQRDGITKSEAEKMVSDVREMIYNCNGDYDEAEEIMMSELGLEMDYITDII